VTIDCGRSPASAPARFARRVRLRRLEGRPLAERKFTRRPLEPLRHPGRENYFGERVIAATRSPSNESISIFLVATRPVRSILRALRSNH
jgi:hypothetical protein